MSQDIQVLLWDVDTNVNTNKLLPTLIRKHKNGTTELSQLYHYLKCDTIDITTRKIGNEYYDIIVDDEGLLKRDRIISYFENDQPQLVGNLIFTTHNQEGENIGLSNKQMQALIQKLKVVYYLLGDDIRAGLNNLTK